MKAKPCGRAMSTLTFGLGLLADCGMTVNVTSLQLNPAFVV